LNLEELAIQLDSILKECGFTSNDRRELVGKLVLGIQEGLLEEKFVKTIIAICEDKGMDVRQKGLLAALLLLARSLFGSMAVLGQANKSLQQKKS